MARKKTGEPVSPLASIFAEVWDAFLDSSDISQLELETMIERSGLAKWRAATRDDVKAQTEGDLEVGDPVLALTDIGRAIVAEGRRTK